MSPGTPCGSRRRCSARPPLSKGYLSSLENREERSSSRPSAQTLYAIAKALGVTIADLLGEQLVLDDDLSVDAALQEFAESEALSPEDIAMLASIQWRGDRPRTVERWRFIYHAMVTSRSLDESPGDAD